MGFFYDVDGEYLHKTAPKVIAELEGQGRALSKMMAEISSQRPERLVGKLGSANQEFSQKLHLFRGEVQRLIQCHNAVGEKFFRDSNWRKYAYDLGALDGLKKQLAEIFYSVERVHDTLKLDDRQYAMFEALLAQVLKTLERNHGKYESSSNNNDLTASICALCASG